MLLLALLFSAGCARHQYRLAEPYQHAQVLSKDPAEVRIEPMRYRFAEVEGRLWIAVANPGDQPVRVVGEGSYIVDPRQRSHPLGTAMIAPKSYIDLILPPAPILYRSEPRILVGFGFGYGGYRRHPHFGPYSGWGYYSPGFYSPFYDPFYGPFYSAPTYIEVRTPHHWNWEQGEARVHFVLELGSGPATNQANRIEHDFLFVRERVK